MVRAGLSDEEARDHRPLLHHHAGPAPAAVPPPGVVEAEGEAEGVDVQLDT